MSMPFVFLWDAARHGTPKSYEHALEMWDDLYHRAEKEETVSEKLAAFGEEFGQFIDGSGEESWLNVLGGTGAYARACRTAVLRLELPDTDWQPVLVKMVEVANKHGLVALHEDGVSLFLPNGKVLPANRAKTWKALRAALKQEGGFPKTLGQFRKWLVPQVEMMLARHGEWEKGTYSQAGNDPTYELNNSLGATYIYIPCEKRDDGFVFHIYAAVINDEVANICGRFNFVCRDVVFEGEIFSSVLKQDRFSKISTPPIKSSADAVNRINQFEQALIPLINYAFSIEGLDQLVNGETDPSYRDYLHNDAFKPQCLIVARLAGNPDFEALITSLAEKPGRFGNAMVWNEEWPKLVKYLREEVTPVV